MELLPALSARRLIQIDIARNEDAVADRRTQGGVVERPVGVDNQPRVPVQERGQTQARSEQTGDRGGMQIDGDMLPEGGLGKPELRERRRHCVGSVIA